MNTPISAHITVVSTTPSTGPDAGSALPAQAGTEDIDFSKLLAGQIAARMGPDLQSTAGELLAEVVRSDSGAAAPAAELEWARLLLRAGVALPVSPSPRGSTVARDARCSS